MRGHDDSSIDMPTALHPLTLLMLTCDGEPVPPRYGYLMKLRRPTKLGYRNPKHIEAIFVATDSPWGYGEDRGYNWLEGSRAKRIALYASASPFSPAIGIPPAGRSRHDGLKGNGMNTLGATVKRASCIAFAIMALSSLATVWAAQGGANGLPEPPSAGKLQTAVFAGGCFWGVDAVFKHVKGVAEVESGYAGGQAATAHYEKVSEGNTGHAEAVRIRFNPAQVSFSQLLQVFFGVAHDPTQLNRQGPDVGSQYRSAIFYTNPEQQEAALGYIQQLTGARTFSRSIVTQVVPLQQFYPAEKYHQNYLALHPQQPYIVFNDLPKLENLRKQFPALYQ